MKWSLLGSGRTGADHLILPPFVQKRTAVRRRQSQLTKLQDDAISQQLVRRIPAFTAVQTEATSETRYQMRSFHRDGADKGML